MRNSVAAICLALAASACVPSTTKTEITNVVQANPDGAVGGLVFDYTGNNAPMAGVAVTLYTGRGPVTATTDAAGYYAFGNVPVGSFTVTFSVAGYGTAVLVGTLDSSDPNRPVTNPQTTLNPIGLVKTDQTFSLRVVDESGNPVTGAVLSATIGIQFVEWSVGNDETNNGVEPRSRGSYVVTATTGADGTATFTGLPAFAKLFGVLDGSGRINVHVAPILITGSTIAYTYNGGDFNIDVLDVNGNGLGSGNNGHDDLPTITLDSPDNALKIEKSSIEYLEGAQNGGFANINGVVGATVSGPITIQFNNTLNSDAKTISIQVLELEEGLEFTGTPARKDRVKPSAATFTPTVNGNILTLTPGTAPAAGKTYWMSLSVQAAQKAGGVLRVFSTTFPFWGPMNTDVAVGAKQLDRSCVPTNNNDTRPTDVVTFLLNEPIGVGTNGVGLASSGRITFRCAAYFAGAEYNGSGPILGTGEIDGAGAIICDQTAPEGRGDITLIFPEALPEGAQQTGFGAKFEIPLSQPSYYECDPSILMTCSVATNQFTRPGTGAHKITFRFQSGSMVVRRLNGTPVSDFTIELPTSANNNDPVPTSCTVT